VEKYQCPTHQNEPKWTVEDRVAKRLNKMEIATDNKKLSALAESRPNTVRAAMREVTRNLD